MDDRRRFPKIIAHRGLCSQHLENTIPAFKAAVDAKVEMIELDVHETRDGQLIVFHDNALNRHTPSWGNLTHAQVQNITPHGDCPPILSDCLKIMNSTPVDIEIKSYVNIANLAKELEAASPPPGSVISSADLHLLKHLSATGVKLPLLLIVSISMQRTMGQNFRNAFFCIAPRLLPKFLDGVAVNHSLAHRPFIKGMQRNGFTVFVWTVDEHPSMEKFISWEVDGIVTNYPERIQDFLRQST